VELLVTISMMAIITAGIFGYSRSNENQNNLNRAEQRLVFELRRAESLAMSNSKNTNDNLEGKWIRWGIRINSDNTSYDIISQTCDNKADPGGLGGDDKGDCTSLHPPVSLETIKLPAGITLSANSGSSVYFLAPEPMVYKEHTRVELNTAVSDFPTFTLKNNNSSSDSSSIRNIQITPIGQINGD